MNPLRFLRTAAVSLAALGTLLPASAKADVAANSSQPQPAAAVADVALQSGGVLRGQMLSGQGQGVAGATVSVWQQDRQVGSAVTQADGQFAIPGLRGGIYQLRSGDSAVVCRLWAPDTAPPAAQPGVLLVDGQQVNRGQQGMGGFLRNPWTWGLLIAAAISIPIALSNNDKKSGS